jgi:NADH-quinone oxidoreductase subunit L
MPRPALLAAVVAALAGPVSAQDSVPIGDVSKFTFDQSKVFPGTVRDYWVYVPKQYDGKTPACVHVNQDGVQFQACFPPRAGHTPDKPGALDRLIHAKKVPVMIGVFVTAFYSFRMYFLVFHGKERWMQAKPGHADHGHDDHGHDPHHDDDHGRHGPVEPHESPKVVTIPLILLAIPAIASGWLIGPMLFGDYFDGAIVIGNDHHAIAHMKEHFHGVIPMILHGLTSVPFWLAIAGAGTAWYLYIKRPDLPAVIKQRFAPFAWALEKKYGFDDFNDWFFAGGARGLGRGLWKAGDQVLIDGLAVNGSASVVGRFAGVVRRLQSGHVYQYAFSMLLGVFVLLTLWLGRS